MHLKDVFKDKISETFNMGAGKSGVNRHERRAAKSNKISNDIELLIHSENHDLLEMKNDPKLKELVNNCYTRGCESMLSKKKNETLRGRLLQGNIVCYFVYTHCSPKPQMLITDDSDKSQLFWEMCTGVKRKAPQGFDKLERGFLPAEEQLATMLSTES